MFMLLFKLFLSCNSLQTISFSAKRFVEVFLVCSWTRYLFFYLSNKKVAPISCTIMGTHYQMGVIFSYLEGKTESQNCLCHNNCITEHVLQNSKMFCTRFLEKYFSDQNESQRYKLYVNWIKEYPVKTVGTVLTK